MLGYCIALPPRRYPSPPSPRRIPHQVRDDGAMRRLCYRPALSALPPSLSFRPPNRNPGLPCAGYCATASPVPILALAPQDPVSEHGVTGREENARTKGGVLPVHSFALSLVLLLCHSGLDPESRVAYAQYCVVSRLLSSSPAPPAWIRLRANWAAVRQSVQASPPVIPASERESIKRGLVCSCPRHCRVCYRLRFFSGFRVKPGMTAGKGRAFHPRQRPPRPRVGARDDRQKTNLPGQKFP